MPLPRKYRPHYESITDYESWEEYSGRIGPFATLAEEYFFKHVLFDHYDDFAGRFPWFKMKDFTYSFTAFTAEWIKNNVVHEDGEGVDYGFQIDSLPNDALVAYMRENHTWPVEPVIFDFRGSIVPKTPNSPTITACHLIEGTRRVSHLKRLLQNGVIRPDSKHRMLTMKQTTTD